MSKVRIAVTDEECRRIYRLRYQVYVRECGRTYAADHVRQELVDSLDDSSVHYYVTDHRDLIVAALRARWDRPTPQLLDAFGARDAAISMDCSFHYASRLCVRSDGRGSLAAWQLVKAAYLHARNCGVSTTYLHCAPALAVMYERLGYEQYRPAFDDPLVGAQVPLRFIAIDDARLGERRSPFAPLAEAHAEWDRWQSMLTERSTPPPWRRRLAGARCRHEPARTVRAARSYDVTLCARTECLSCRSPDRWASGHLRRPPMETYTPDTLADRRNCTKTARQALADLNDRLELVLAGVRASAFGRTLLSPDTSAATVKAIVREVMWAVYAYQPHTTEAGFAMLGRLPKHEGKLIMSLMHHKADEAGHSEWARRDFLLLGGAEARLHRPMSPATFAVASTWHWMARQEDPFGYLGAEYLFECLTMRVTREVLPVLEAKGISGQEAGFVVDHATEDIRHTNLIIHWILDVVSRHPVSADAMLRCFDYFNAVYPAPVWAEAMTRACHPERDLTARAAVLEP